MVSWYQTEPSTHYTPSFPSSVWHCLHSNWFSWGRGIWFSLTDHWRPSIRLNVILGQHWCVAIPTYWFHWSFESGAEWNTKKKKKRCLLSSWQYVTPWCSLYWYFFSQEADVSCHDAGPESVKSVKWVSNVQMDSNVWMQRNEGYQAVDT